MTFSLRGSKYRSISYYLRLCVHRQDDRDIENKGGCRILRDIFGRIEILKGKRGLKQMMRIEMYVEDLRIYC